MACILRNARHRRYDRAGRKQGEEKCGEDREIFRAVWGASPDKLSGVESVLDQPATEYRRIARRVRCQLGDNPIGKQRALAALARHADLQYKSPAPEWEAATRVEDGVRAFAASVSSAMEGPILRFSKRQELIRQAEGLGIRRFDANLLIAAVQHRLGGEKADRLALARPKRKSWGMALPIALVVGLQTIIALGAWMVLHS